MKWERHYDSAGNETNMEGVPYRELFTRQELMRLGFEVFRLTGQLPDDQPDPTASPLMQRVIKQKFGLRFAESQPVIQLGPAEDDSPPAV